MNLEEILKTTKFHSLQHKAGLNILYTAWWLKSLTSAELKKYALTPEQYNVLRILRGKHPELMCVKDIGERMIEPSSNVPRIIDRLEVKKLVRRSTSPQDKRETVVTITEAGITILSLATKDINQLFAEKLNISTEEAEILDQLLERMRQNG